MVSRIIDRTTGAGYPSAIKTPCRVASTDTLLLNGLGTIDGIMVIEGDRVLVKNQSDARTNGIYVASTGIWQRASDCNDNRDLGKGTVVWVTDGLANGTLNFYCTAENPVVVGASTVNFSTFQKLSGNLTFPGNVTVLGDLTLSGQLVTDNLDLGDGAIARQAPLHDDSERVATTGFVHDEIAAIGGGPSLPDATTSAKGIVELATDAEAITGADAVRAVTPHALNAAIAATSFVAPRATIVMYASYPAPSGWLLCDGAAVSRATYSALFGTIGTLYGPGDGASTFNVPDLRGRVVAGFDGNGTGRLSFAGGIGTSGGAERHTLQISEMPNHSHTTTAAVAAAQQVAVGNGTTQIRPVTATPTTTGAIGGSASHNNTQPTIVLCFIIKV